MAEAINPRDSADDVVLLRTQVTYEAEMLGGLLDEEGIPYRVQREIAGNVQLPLSHGGLTPGQGYVLLVPRLGLARAQAVLAALPPASAGFSGPDADQERSDSDRVHRRGKIVAGVIVSLLLIWLVVGLAGVIHSFFFQ